MADLQLRGYVPHVRLSASSDGSSDRTLSGTITEFETPSTTQRVFFHAGALRAREPLDRVKLLLDHDTRQPVGYMTQLSADATEGTFYVPESAEGDAALAGARNGLRDGLSVGFAATQYAYGEDDSIHIYDAELYEVSLVAVPDFSGARIAASAALNNEGNDMTRAQLEKALAGKAGQLTPAVFSAQLSQIEQPPAQQPGTVEQPAQPAPAQQPLEQPAPQPETQPQPQQQAPVTGELSGIARQLQGAGPVHVPPGAPLAHTRPRTFDLAAATRHVASVVSSAMISGDSNAIRLALQDITQANDAGHGYIGRDDWAGELWTAAAVSRPWIDAFGQPKPLTSVSRRGFRWTETPTVDEYAGDKAEIPTSTAQTEDDSWRAWRVAGGWDFDRIYVDLGDAAYLEAFWGKAAEDYKRKSNAGMRTRLLAAARALPNVPASAGVIGLLKTLLRDGRAIEGGVLNRVFVGEDLFTLLEDLDTGPGSVVPLWLKSATLNADLESGTGQLSGLQITLDSTLPPRRAFAADSRAIVQREVQPFRVNALDLAHGGIDMGLFAYLMLEVHDPRLVIRRDLAAAA